MSQISDKVKGAGLKSKNKIAKDTYELTFTLSDDFSFKAGQYVWVVLPKIDPPDPKGERRAFSITSSPENPKEISIIFRKGESNYKKSLLSLKKGDEVQIVGPFGSSFVVDEKSEDSFVLIAGGVGVAPFLSLLRYFDKKGTNNKFCVVTLNSSEDKVVYENELSEISSRNKNVDYACRYSGLRKESLESLPLDVGESKVFVCGPQGMVDHVDGLLNKLGVAKEDRYFEQFYPSVEKRFEVEDFRHLKPISFDDIRKKAVEFLFPYFILLGLVTSVTVGGLLFFSKRHARTNSNRGCCCFYCSCHSVCF